MNATWAATPPWVARMSLARQVFRAYVSPLVFVFGILGNVAVLVVFASQAQANRFSVYAISIALSDSAILLFNTLINDFMGTGLNYLFPHAHLQPLDTWSTFWCKFLEFTVPCFVCVSGYNYVAFSVDRLLTLWCPMKFQSHKHIKYTVFCCCSVLVVSVVLMIPVAISYQLKTIGDKASCSLSLDNTEEAMKYFALYMTSIVSYCLPCLITIPINIAIVMKVFQVKRRRHSMLIRSTKRGGTDVSLSQRHAVAEASYTEQPQPNEASLQRGGRASILERRDTIKSAGHSSLAREMSRIIAQLTVTTIFVCFALPVAVVIFVRMSYEAQNETHKWTKAYIRDLSKLLTSLVDINYMITGYLYLYNFPFFRKQVTQWLTCVCWRSPPNNNRL